VSTGTKRPYAAPRSASEVFAKRNSTCGEVVAGVGDIFSYNPIAIAVGYNLFH
jgi:hypothetical protein